MLNRLKKKLRKKLDVLAGDFFIWISFLLMELGGFDFKEREEDDDNLDENT